MKTSMIDFPGKVACVVFFGGCNMNCWFCHNRQIIGKFDAMDNAEVFAFLSKRKGMLDGVVLSGGEPTLQPGLLEFAKYLKDEGFAVKLDTNGLRPGVVRGLIERGLVDYIAMDIKAPFDKYKSATCTNDDIGALKESIALIMASKVPYEFRTTFLPTLDKADIVEIAKSVEGAALYIVQPYRHTDTYTQILGMKLDPHTPEYMRKAADAAAKYVKSCLYRE